MPKKKLSYMMEGIYVGWSPRRGRGMFTQEKIAAGKIVETAPVIVLTPAQRKMIDQTDLHDYIFEWGNDRKSCCMALGYVPLYNHSYKANCEYEMEYDKQIMSIKTVRDIKAGEELFINYNGTWDNDKSIWFDVK